MDLGKPFSENFLMVKRFLFLIIDEVNHVTIQFMLTYSFPQNIATLINFSTWI